MQKIIVKEFNSQTGEEIEREMNAEELVQLELDVAEVRAEKDTAEALATTKAALLNRLGITEDEAKLLLS